MFFMFLLFFCLVENEYLCSQIEIIDIRKFNGKSNFDW